MGARGFGRVAAVSLLLVTASACDGGPSDGASAGGRTPSGSVTSGDPSPTGAPDPTPSGPATAADFDPGRFGHSTSIDNGFLPLRPGTRYVYRGSSLDGKRRLPHRVEFTVTDLTKEIDGVRAVVVYDLDYTQGELEEAELTFFAQDDDGNVWHLGQYSELWEGREWLGGRVFFQGTEGARAGIMMQADPRSGTPGYSEGFAPPPWFWADRARVFKVDQTTCVPTRCYDGVLVTDEFAKGEEGDQLKFYAPGVGVVRVGWLGADEPEKESLVLAELEHLGPKALAAVRAEALELEKRAYLYSLTPPAERG